MPDKLTVAVALLFAVAEILEAIYWRRRARIERHITSALIRVFLRRSSSLKAEDVVEICQTLDHREGPAC